jgi:hypothetical protein
VKLCPAESFVIIDVMTATPASTPFAAALTRVTSTFTLHFFILAERAANAAGNTGSIAKPAPAETAWLAVLERRSLDSICTTPRPVCRLRPISTLYPHPHPGTLLNRNLSI